MTSGVGRVRRLRRPLLLFPAFLAFVVHVPALGLGFAWDDIPAVAEDARIRDPANFPALLVAPYRTDVPAHQSPYRPLTSASYALSWWLGGGSPFAFHLFNVLAHVLVTGLVVLLLLRLGAGTAAAALGGAIFAVHPVHVEAVANVVGRGDVLVTLFVLAGVHLHLARGPRSVARVAGIGLAYLLALGAKESGVVLPGLLLLVDLFRSGDEPGARRRRLARSIPVHGALAGVLGLYLVIRRAVLGVVVHGDVATYVAALPDGLRVTTAVANLGELARLLLFPLDLSVDYGPAVVMPAGPEDLRFWAGVAVAVGFGALALIELRSERKRAWTALAVAWVATSWLLVSNLVVPLPMWIAERTLYLPSVGTAFLVAGAVPLLRTRLAPAGLRAARAGAVALVLLGGWRSADRCGVWDDNESVIRDLVESHPESYRARWWVGNALARAGRLDEAVARLSEAHALDPTGPRVGLDYARVLLLAGRWDRAEAVARAVSPSWPNRYLYLAESLVARGATDEARAVLADGLRRFPDAPALVRRARELAGGAGEAGLEGPVPPPGFEPGT